MLFGQVKEQNVVLSEMGKISENKLLDIPNHHPAISLDAFIVMPNHIHIIFVIKQMPQSKGAACCARNNDKNHQEQSENCISQNSEFHSKIASQMGNLSIVIRSYKSTVAKRCREMGFNQFAWHRSFHETIIRNEKQYNAMVDYIRKNPINWMHDPENPANL